MKKIDTDNDPILDILVHIQEQVASIKRDQAKMQSDFDEIRAYLAITLNRQNASLETTKKKQTASPRLSNALPGALPNWKRPSVTLLNGKTQFSPPINKN